MGPLPRSRRSKAILFGGTSASGAISHLSALAKEFGAEFRGSDSVAKLRSFIEDQTDALCLGVFDADFVELLSVARMVNQASPNSELVFLSSEAEEAQLKAAFGPAPRLGTHISFARRDDRTLGRALRSAFLRADQRRATRTTLDRFNAKLSAPAQNLDALALRELTISDRFLSSILDSAFDAVILVDNAGRVAAFNPAAERLFQRSRKETLSMPVRELVLGSWAVDVQSCLDRRTQRMIQSSFLSGDKTRHIEISTTPVVDPAGNLAATSLIVRDITLRLQSEDALRLNEKLAAVGRLASSISHEINNPLESVTNLLYLSRSLAESAELQGYLDLADQELRRMSLITNQTLRFHRQASAPTPIKAEEIIETALSIFQSRILNSRISVVREEKSTASFIGYEGEIRQVVNNLIGNAIDAMPSGGKLYLRTSETSTCKHGARCLRITVADTGSGMPPNTLKNLFEPFFTTKGAMGTGLGLWISKEIVDRHSGRLQVRSRQSSSGSGTVFQMYLPYDVAPTAASITLP